MEALCLLLRKLHLNSEAQLSLVTVPATGKLIEKVSQPGQLSGQSQPEPASARAEIWDVMTLGELLLTYLIMQRQDLQDHNHTAPLGPLPVCSTND